MNRKVATWDICNWYINPALNKIVAFNYIPRAHVEESVLSLHHLLKIPPNPTLDQVLQGHTLVDQSQNHSYNIIIMSYNDGLHYR